MVFVRDSGVLNIGISYLGIILLVI